MLFYSRGIIMSVATQVAEIKALKEKQEAELRAKTASMQKDFENYIADKSIALMTRWNDFLEAPEELSDHLDSFPTFHYDTIGVGLDFFMDELMSSHPPYQDKTIDLKNIVSLYIKEDGTVNLEMVKLDLENDKYSDEQLKENIIALVEEILEHNLGAFEWDS